MKSRVPFEFVVEALGPLRPQVRAMFGCHAIYLGPKIVLILRDKPSAPADNGIWLATTAEHHASLHRDFPALRSIQLFGPKPSGWQVLPVDAESFESDAFRLIDLVSARDPRIGKIPTKKKTAGQTRRRPVKKK